MLEITIPETEYFDQDTNSFLFFKPMSLTLEHSLVSLSKWESKWRKPFLSKEEKTNAETLDYIRCMTITQNVDPKVYNNLTSENLESIRNYIQSPMTATTFSNRLVDGRREIITSELIYYWMIAMNIPFECQKWHLNRLLTLINVCAIKNQPPKKMSKSALMNRNRSLNEARRAALHTNG